MNKTPQLYLILSLLFISCLNDLDDNYISVFDDISFINTYGGSQEDHLVSIVETPDANLALLVILIVLMETLQIKHYKKMTIG